MNRQTIANGRYAGYTGENCAECDTSYAACTYHLVGHGRTCCDECASTNSHNAKKPGQQEPSISDRSLELAIVALESAAHACANGPALRGDIDLDPLAREYLDAAAEVESVLNARA